LELGADGIDEADHSRRRSGVREQALFVMGDSRDNSKDSRAFGFVPREKIVGRVHGTLASFDKNRWCKPRFGRFGSGLDG
jgi:signal peptidase I